MSRLARQVAFFTVATVSIGLTICLALEQREGSARCGPGMISVESRCCGEGQVLVNRRCVGAPVRCAPTLSVSKDACVCNPSARVRENARATLVAVADWERQAGSPTAKDLAAFDLDMFEVTTQRYRDCVLARACEAAPLSQETEPGVPVTQLTFAEALQFCQWAGGRLPASIELAAAAAGEGNRRYPWGETGAVCRRAAWGLLNGPCGYGATGPEIAGTHPDGATASGIQDLAGNVAEWAIGASGDAEVYGSSWADPHAHSLRSWVHRPENRETRSPEIGFRCAYSVAAR